MDGCDIAAPPTRPRTASAWVVADGLFPFVVGPDETGERLGVVRLGGHMEEGETPWECAIREVREESGLEIRHVEPPGTYRLPEDQLQPVGWNAAWGPRPIIAAERAHYVCRAWHTGRNREADISL